MDEGGRRLREDARLIEAARGGDEGAFEALYRRHRDYVLAVRDHRARGRWSGAAPRGAPGVNGGGRRRAGPTAANPYREWLAA